MGAKTKFSASEAADAMNYMAMAGWKTSDMLDGIEGIMNLAAASGEDLATTSDIVVTGEIHSNFSEYTRKLSSLLMAVCQRFLKVKTIIRTKRNSI